MEKFFDQDNSFVAMIVIATSLTNRYDEWSSDDNIMGIVDINKNSICVGLKEMYPELDNKIVQSIALAFTIYMMMSIEFNENKTITEINNNNINDTIELEKNITNFAQYQKYNIQ